MFVVGWELAFNVEDGFLGKVGLSGGKLLLWALFDKRNGLFILVLYDLFKEEVTTDD